MNSYRTVMRLPHVFIGGTADPAFSGRYERYRTSATGSQSFYHVDWPKGAPRETHVTVAPQGKNPDSALRHFHISVVINAQNVPIYFNWDAGRNNLSASVNTTGKLPEVLDAFYDFYNDKIVYRSIDRMAVEFFNKAANPAVQVIEVWHPNEQERVEIGDVDLTPAFDHLFKGIGR